MSRLKKYAYINTIIQNKTWHVHTDNRVTLFLYERRSFNVKYFVDIYRYISIIQIQKLLN